MRFLCCISALIFLCSALSAKNLNTPEKNAVGAAFSYQELTLCFEHNTTPTSRYCLSANADMSDVMTGEHFLPGLSIDFTHHYIFASKTFPGGETLSGYAGPGIKLGYVRGESGRFGFAGGFCAEIGLDWHFIRRPVTLSFSMKPFLALAVSRPEPNSLLQLSFHKRGLMSSLWPHLGIKYNF